jgi:proteic killer suppression protein
VITRVELNKQAKKSLLSCPLQVQKKLRVWVASVQQLGLEEARRAPGYHDEPVRGDRVGQRSIRLNAAYRAFYVMRADGTVEFAEVIDVNKHEY